MTRGILAALALALASVALIGCGAGSDRPYQNTSDGSGASLDEARTLWEGVPGVTAFTYETALDSRPGPFGGTTETMDATLALDVDAEHHIADKRGFVDALMRTVWAVDDGSSVDGQVTIVFSGGFDPSDEWQDDLGGIFQDARVNDEHDSSGAATGRLQVQLGASTVTKSLGRWPGALPSAAAVAEVIADGAPESTGDVPSIVSYDGVVTRTPDDGSDVPAGQVCYLVQRTTGTTARGQRFPGDATATLMQGTTEVATVSGPAARGPLPLCADASIPRDSLTITLQTQAAPGWAPFEQAGLPLDEAAG